MQTTISVLLAVNAAELRSRLAASINADPVLSLIAGTNGVTNLNRLAEGSLRADVVVIETPDTTTANTVRQVAARGSTRILVVCKTLADAPVLEFLQIGVHGVMTIDTAGGVLAKAARCVMAGQYWIGRKAIDEIVKALAQRHDRQTGGRSDPSRDYSLTPTEGGILELVASGCSNKDIAAQRNISSATVKTHLTNIFHKTGVANRLQLALIAVRHRPDDAI